MDRVQSHLRYPLIVQSIIASCGHRGGVKYHDICISTTYDLTDVEAVDTYQDIATLKRSETSPSEVSELPLSGLGERSEVVIMSRPLLPPDVVLLAKYVSHIPVPPSPSSSSQQPQILSADNLGAGIRRFSSPSGRPPVFLAPAPAVSQADDDTVTAYPIFQPEATQDNHLEPLRKTPEASQVESQNPFEDSVSYLSPLQVEAWVHDKDQEAALGESSERPPSPAKATVGGDSDIGDLDDEGVCQREHVPLRSVPSSRLHTSLIIHLPQFTASIVISPIYSTIPTLCAYRSPRKTSRRGKSIRGLIPSQFCPALPSD